MSPSPYPTQSQSLHSPYSLLSLSVCAFLLLCLFRCFASSLDFYPLPSGMQYRSLSCQWPEAIAARCCGYIKSGSLNDRVLGSHPSLLNTFSHSTLAIPLSSSIPQLHTSYLQVAAQPHSTASVPNGPRGVQGPAASEQDAQKAAGHDMGSGVCVQCEFQVQELRTEMEVKFSVLGLYVNDLLANMATWQKEVEVWVPHVLIVRVWVAGKSIVPLRTACSWALQCRSSNFICAFHQNAVHG